jgi:hypothetical protein
MKFVEVEVAPIQSEQIILAACTDRVKPIAYGPKNKYTSIGQNVTFTCTGDFGCNSDSARDVSWYDDHWNTRCSVLLTSNCVVGSSCFIDVICIYLRILVSNMIFLSDDVRVV